MSTTEVRSDGASGRRSRQESLRPRAELTSGRYTVLADRKHVFGYKNIAPIVSDKLLAAEGAGRAKVVAAVSADLTTAAMRAMNRTMDIDEQTAAAAAPFLKASGRGAWP